MDSIMMAMVTPSPSKPHLLPNTKRLEESSFVGQMRYAIWYNKNLTVCLSRILGPNI